MTELKEIFDEIGVLLKKIVKKNKEYYVYLQCCRHNNLYLHDNLKLNGFEKIDSSVWLDNYSYEWPVYIILNNNNNKHVSINLRVKIKLINVNKNFNTE